MGERCSLFVVGCSALGLSYFIYFFILLREVGYGGGGKEWHEYAVAKEGGLHYLAGGLRKTGIVSTIKTNSSISPAHSINRLLL